MVQYNIVTTIILVFKREGYQALSQLANWVFLRMGVLILLGILYSSKVTVSSFS